MHNNYGSNFQSLHSQIKAFAMSHDRRLNVVMINQSLQLWNMNIATICL